MRVLNHEDVNEILRSMTIETILATSQRSLEAFSEKTCVCPQRIIVDAPLFKSLHMPSVLAGVVAEKTVTVSKSGASGLPASIAILDNSGKIACMMNADRLTGVRTAGCSVLSSMLIRDSVAHQLESWVPKNLMIFGGGEQAYQHARLHLQALPSIEQVIFCLRRPSQITNAFCEDLRKSFKTEISIKLGSDSLSDMISAADIISCCTPSTKPLFQYGRMQDRTKRLHITMIGSYTPEMSELDAASFGMAKAVLVDSRDDCLREAGDLINAIKQKCISPDSLIELGTARHLNLDVGTEHAITIYKSVGISVMDNGIAQEIMRQAEADDIGVNVRL